MSAIRLRLPDSMHNSAQELADKEQISINQFIRLALAEKIAALLADDYICKRAARASQDKFDRAMAKVVDAEPREEDRL